MSLSANKQETNEVLFINSFLLNIVSKELKMNLKIFSGCIFFFWLEDMIGSFMGGREVDSLIKLESWMPLHV